MSETECNTPKNLHVTKCEDLPHTETTTPQEQDKKLPENKLSREQRRRIERIETEARTVFHQLGKRFFDFFIVHDQPESVEVVDKIRQLDAQWRLYCQTKRLNIDAYPMVKNYCESVCEQYLAKKNEQPCAALEQRTE